MKTIAITVQCTPEEAMALLTYLQQHKLPMTTVPATPEYQTPPTLPTVEQGKFADAVPVIAGGIDDQKFRFGKYKGRFTPRELLTVDPAYLIWCVENLDMPPLTDDCEAAARAIMRGEVPKARVADEDPSALQQMVDDDIPF